MKPTWMGFVAAVGVGVGWGCGANSNRSDRGTTGGAIASLTGGQTSTGGHGSGTTGAAAGASSFGGDTTTGGREVTGGSVVAGGSVAAGGERNTGGHAVVGGTDATGGRGTVAGDGNLGGDDATGGGVGAGGVAGVGGEVPTGGASSPGGNAGAGGTSVLPPGQHILFEMIYLNFAWGASASGMFVTANGSVYTYSPDLPEDRSELPALLGYWNHTTLEEITAKHDNSGLVTTVPESELLEMVALVDQARRGELNFASCCMDAGENDFIAWEYDPVTSTYSPLLLAVDGDLCGGNSAPAAQRLADWMDSLLHSSGRTCKFDGHDCVGADCTEARPECDHGVSNVVDGCWGDRCIDPTWCGEVASCADCGEDAICVLSADGAAHCSFAGCPRDGCYMAGCAIQDVEVTCECAGDRICAGGGDWCRGSEADGFRCVEP